MRFSVPATGALVALLLAVPGDAQQFVDGLAQPVFDVTGPNLITEQVWVEVPGVDRALGSRPLRP
jgi:hypothetical protein